MIVRKGYTFDDVLLIPRHSNINSRTEIDLSVELGKDVNLEIPIVSANMKTVSGPLMCRTMSVLGGLGILHRFQGSTPEIFDDYKKLIDSFTSPDFQTLQKRVGISIGVQPEFKSLLSSVADSIGVLNVICIDLAHGDSKHAVQMTEYVSKNYPKALVISGNVATSSGAQTLYDAGADVIRCGIGPGSLCSTRIETGNGVPQLTALSEIYEQSYDAFSGKRKFKIIADGGVKNAGDLTKALVFSDAVMLGNLLAGTDDAPGDLITVSGKQYKTYVGSSTHKTNHIEGVTGLVPTKGPVDIVLAKLLEGLASGCSYQGANNLKELRMNAEFVEITNAGLAESKPHSVTVR